jgi:hypothetical protein
MRGLRELVKGDVDRGGCRRSDEAAGSDSQECAPRDTWDGSGRFRRLVHIVLIGHRKPPSNVPLYTPRGASIVCGCAGGVKSRSAVSARLRLGCGRRSMATDSQPLAHRCAASTMASTTMLVRNLLCLAAKRLVDECAARSAYTGHASHRPDRPSRHDYGCCGGFLEWRRKRHGASGRVDTRQATNQGNYSAFLFLEQLPHEVR